MKMSLKNSIIVLWIYLMYLLGIYLFFSGYLLKRIVIHQNSTQILNGAYDITCKNYSSLNCLSEKFVIPNKKISNKYTKLKRYQKSIIIIIDALRQDFAVYNDSIIWSSYYQNNMKVFREMKEIYPDHCLLFPLIADPPTTTLQRLAGITTGSLPTFIDLGLNFASASIQEDNLIWQLNHLNKNIVFLGDETWESIFPNQFHRSYPFPSFNVMDLDTVDNGILANIYGELEKNDWSVIIAHFLGVDHCGHRYSPNHPAMMTKLKQMDSMIRNVIKKMPNDTILVVLGDHGMTETGDHGGDSSSEVNTVLFLYSHSKLMDNEHSMIIEPLRQIDLLPTLSLLLGLPIPFSNLGSVMPHLFSARSFTSSSVCFHETIDASLGAALALAENAYQVKQYITEYSSISQDLPLEVIMDAETLFNSTCILWEEINEDVNHSVAILASIINGYQKYLQFIQEECSKKWAKFDITLMILGSVTLCIAVFLNVLYAYELTITKLQLFATISTILIVLCTIYFNVHFVWTAVSMTVVCIYFLYVRNYFKNLVHTTLKLLTFPNIIALLLFLSAFSNSFVVYEALSLLFMLQSMIIFKYFPYLCRSLSITSEKSKKSKTIDNSNNIVVSVLLCFLLLVYRISFMFQKCREEQVPCTNSEFLTPLESLVGISSSYQVMRLGIAWCAVIIPSAAFIVIINYVLKEKNYTAATICINYGLIFASVCICLHWWLMIVPPQILDRILGQNQMILVRAALVISFIIFICTWIFPHLPEKPLECPTNFMFTGSFMLFLFSILFPLYLTTGEGLAISIALMMTTLFILLTLDSITSKNSESSSTVNVALWWLSSCFWFYGTGHQPTLSTLHWDSAFIISKEVVSYTLSAVFVTMNTFSSQLFHGASLPLLLVWSKPPKDLKMPLFRLLLKYVAFHGFKLLATVLSCFLLRRHLMVWKIFTPKLLFEALAFLVTLVSVCLSYVFLIRVTCCFHKQMKKSAGQLWFLKDD